MMIKAAVLSSLVSSVALAADSTFLVLSNGQESCGQYLSSDWQEQVIDSIWILGYISGVNSRAPGGDRLVGRSFTDGPTVIMWLRNYCQSHALDLLPSAAEALRAEFSKRESAR